jgi:hypothetical protein
MHVTRSVVFTVSTSVRHLRYTFLAQCFNIEATKYLNIFMHHIIREDAGITAYKILETYEGLVVINGHKQTWGEPNE